MAEQQRVILYGDSILLAGVQASLSVLPDLDIITLEELPGDWVAILHELHPSALIFDLGSTRTDFPLAILQQSNLLLIGIDPDHNQVLLWSGRHLRELSGQDLVGVIQRKWSKPETLHGGENEQATESK